MPMFDGLEQKARTNNITYENSCLMSHLNSGPSSSSDGFNQEYINIYFSDVQFKHVIDNQELDTWDMLLQ